MILVVDGWLVVVAVGLLVSIELPMQWVAERDHGRRGVGRTPSARRETPNYPVRRMQECGLAGCWPSLELQALRRPSNMSYVAG